MDRYSQFPRAAGDGQPGREQGKKVIAFDLDISVRTVKLNCANLMMRCRTRLCLSYRSSGDRRGQRERYPPAGPGG